MQFLVHAYFRFVRLRSRACAGAKGTVWRGLAHAPWSTTSLRDGWTVLHDGDDDAPMLVLALAVIRAAPCWRSCSVMVWRAGRPDPEDRRVGSVQTLAARAGRGDGCPPRLIVIPRRAAPG